MKNNKYPQSVIIEASIDLHGMTDYEVVENVENFIKISRNLGHKNIKIITGKGLHSVNGATLKKATRNILTQQNIKFTTAKIQDGGSGAFVIKL